MQELENQRGNRRRRNNKVETPGESNSQEQTTKEQQAVTNTPAPRNETLTEQIAEEAQKGNVNAHHNHKPKIGDRWAGMVLTEHGWAAADSKE
ncbi:hypothetical protein ACQV2B_19020 [Pantoea allii]|uniref:hypothetical protein n=1 Tax=Pantoea allii TaxID=574096 RepID=UPI003D3149AF